MISIYSFEKFERKGEKQNLWLMNVLFVVLLSHFDDFMTVVLSLVLDL